MKKFDWIPNNFGWLLVGIVFIAWFWHLFYYEVVGSDTSFFFQFVAAIMSTGLIAIVTMLMFQEQSKIESKKENSAKIFEKKIEFYNQAIDGLDEIYAGGVGDKTSHQLLFLVSKAILVASPDAADKFAQLYISIQNNENVPKRYGDFLRAAREDLDLVDQISDGTADSFDPILARLEGSIKQESRHLRYWSDEEKITIIRKYDKLKTGKGSWLKNEHGLYYSQIANWRKQLSEQL